MELLNYLETANFLKLDFDCLGNKLTYIEKINKIKVMLQNKTLPGSITLTLGNETVIIKDKLEEFLLFKSMTKQYSNSIKESDNCLPLENKRPKTPTMLTIKETSNETKIPESRIRQLVKEHRIDYIECGRKVLINLEKFINYLNTPNVFPINEDSSNKYGVKE